MQSSNFKEDCHTYSQQKCVSHIPSAISIDQLNLANIEENSMINIISPNESNNLLFVKDLIKQFVDDKKIDECVIISSESTDSFFGEFIDGTIYHKYDDEIINKILVEQQSEIKNKTNKKILIVFNNCFNVRAWGRDDDLRELFLNGRHYGITRILISKIAIKFSPEIRSAFDYNFLGYDDYIANQKRLYDYYAGYFPSFNDFLNIFRAINRLQSGCFMCIKVSSDSYNVPERIKWFSPILISPILLKDQFSIKSVELKLGDESEKEGQEIKTDPIDRNELINLLRRTITMNEKIVSMIEKLI
jgi:hypothetical protein